MPGILGQLPKPVLEEVPVWEPGGCKGSRKGGVRVGGASGSSECH